MTKQKKSAGSVLAAVGNKILDAAQEYSLDRLVWCIATIALCWTEVQNYHEYIFILRMYILAGVGAFYSWRLGCLAKGKRVLCGIVTLAGIGLTINLVRNNFYVNYMYMNLPLGIFITVLANLYVLVIWDAIQERKISWNMGPSLVLVLMLLAMQNSVYDYRQYYLYILISLLPFVMMKKEECSRSYMLNGMLDGMCIGFLVVQGYAWMHRPYNYSSIRYTGISNVCTTMSRIYLPFFAAWIIRYVQVAYQKLNVFNGILRMFCWLMATFVLALEYLTGSRSAVLSMMFMTALALAVRYVRIKEQWWKRIGKFCLWAINCACVGIVSLALVPLAYQSVRYIPAYFNEPDYVDYKGYRLNSVPVQKWGERFDWNFEYHDYAIKVDDPIDSPKYATFEEAVSFNIGRIIPGMESYLENVLAETLLESNLERAKYYLEQGVYGQSRYESEVAYWSEVYNVIDKSDVIEQSNNDVIRAYTSIVETLLDNLVLRIDAEAIAVDEVPVQEGVGRGDTAENPWFTEYSGNGMSVRNAIHKYAISKLNIEGHEVGTFSMWLNPGNNQPHAHNIFLIAGYDFGIPTMILMILLFIVTFLVSMYNAIKFGKLEYLLPALLVIGITVFGWFESGFDYWTGIMMWVFLCVCFTDVLRVKKRKNSKDASEEALVPQQAAGSEK